jgi:hypothetical protein
MAHMCARLRLADHISRIVARLTPDSGGRTLGRAGFAPAGRQTKFPEVIASSLPFDPHCLVALIFLSSLALRVGTLLVLSWGLAFVVILVILLALPGMGASHSHNGV